MPNYNHHWLHMAAPPALMTEIVSVLGVPEPEVGDPVMYGDDLLDFERILPVPANLCDPDKEDDWTSEEVKYDWRIAHWGTRSGPWEVQRSRRPGEATTSYYFVTAYTPPLPLLDHLAARWPDLKMHLNDVSIDDMVGGEGAWRAGERLYYETVEGEFDVLVAFFTERGAHGVVQWLRHS